VIEIVASPSNFEAVKAAIADKGIEIESAELTMHPQNTVKVEGKEAEQLLKLMDALEDHDDIDNVYSNFDIDVELMEDTE
jgi:transcriptional/translational regulatory protein YebC/TACO1